MAIVHIDFQEGFTGERVVVRHLEHQIFDKHVTTKNQIGFADSVELDVRNASDIVISLPEKNVTHAVAVTAEKPVFVGVNIRNGRLTSQLSSDLFGYL